MNLFKITGRITAENSEGELSVRKRVVLLEVSSFTEAEVVAQDYLNTLTNYTDNTVVDKIERVQFSGVSLNDVIAYTPDTAGSFVEYIPYEFEDMFWELTVAFEEEAGKNKVKVVKEKFIMPASSQKDAIIRLEDELKNVTFTYKIVNGKVTDLYSALITKITHVALATKANLPINLEEEEDDN